MAEFPLLPLPAPKSVEPPPGFGGGPRLRLPSRVRQGERLGPVFKRLRDAFGKGRDPLELRRDPAAMAPERALVVEVAGTTHDFRKAVRLVPGLAYLGEDEFAFDADEDFAELDTRKGRKDKDRTDRPVGGRLYLAMPDTAALKQLLSLWDRHQAGHKAPTHFAVWWKLFNHLHALRTWGREDRVSDSTIAWLTDQAEMRTERIRVEVELWSYSGHEPGAGSGTRLGSAVRDVGGEILRTAAIPEIAYQAALVALPPAAALRLQRREPSPLADCDPVMFIRPQTTAEFPTSVESLPPGPPVEPIPDTLRPPIAALLDGVPVARHELLDRRLKLDDPDDFAGLSEVLERRHGTAMASLILHGDRNLREPALRRLLYVRPVLYAPGRGEDERPHRDGLLIDMIYRAVLRMKVGDAEEQPIAPSVFLVNLSLGDSNRPFTGRISPWARLLDLLADRFGILFLVSAGNVSEPLPLPALDGPGDWNQATPKDREHAILIALGEQRSQRTLLSPAEALNVATVGAWSEDATGVRSPSPLVFPVYEDEPGPNVTSAMGLGHRKVIKPDISLPGGREHVQVMSSGATQRIKALPPGRLYGLKAAAPDPTGRLDAEALTGGTSAATALATRAAHRLHDALMDEDNGAILDGVDPAFYAVIVKALLVHRANWGEKGALLHDLYGPVRRGQHVAHKDDIARTLGYGRPHVEETMTCAANRATLVGFGSVSSDRGAFEYRLPLPPSLERVTEPRAVTLTLAWFSPVTVRHLAYRRAKLEIKPIEFKKRAGVERASDQPSDKSVPRGSLFHVRYTGEDAVKFVDDGHLRFLVFCREQGGPLDREIRYGLAVTIEAGESIPVYQEIRQRLLIRPRVTGGKP